ncbi:MAG: hypothetical protein HDR21_04845 [Lachnospiraceae bacterium]|nr:hypothetical protein [Lachnospiraceae bacterium]
MPFHVGRVVPGTTFPEFEREDEKDMSEKQQNTVQNQAVQNEKKNNPQLRLLIFLIELIVLIAAIAGSVVLVKSYNDPKRVADSYFNALKAGDYATAYSYLQTEDGMETSAFLNADVYASVMEEYGFTGETADVRDSIEKEYGETYYVLDAGKGTHAIQVVETGKKNWFFFQEYEVRPYNFYAEDVYITAPKVMTVSVNGIELNSGNSTRDDHSSEVYLSAYETAYKIDRMFVGDYRIQVSGDVFQTYTEDVTVNVYYNVFMMEIPTLKEGTLERIAETLPDTIQSLYQSALNGDDTQTAFAAAGLHEPSETEAGRYEVLMDDFYLSDGYFTEVTLSEFEAETYGGYFDWETGEYRSNITMDFNIAYSYDILDWWTESYYESKESEAYGYFSCDLIYRNGEWVLEEIYISSGVYAW